MSDTALAALQSASLWKQVYVEHDQKNVFKILLAILMGKLKFPAGAFTKLLHENIRTKSKRLVATRFYIN